jgi:hypothetical protein
MSDKISNDSDETRGEAAILPDHSEEIANAVTDVLAEVGVEIQTDEALTIAKELVEKFKSPLMMQRAAGARSEVSVVNSPTGGIESARSRKVANVFYNLKSAALAMPVPALAGKLVEHNTPEKLRITLGAITALFGFLSIAATAVNIPLTRQGAAILQFMWASVSPGSDVIWHDGLLEKINAEFNNLGWRPINDEELISYLEALEKIGCIERAPEHNSISLDQIHWRLKEKVRVSFEGQ